MFSSTPVAIPQNKTDPATEYSYSMGTAPIIQTLLNTLHGRLNKYDTVLINFSTLVRNNCNKEDTIKELTAKSKKEISDVMTTVIDHIKRSFRVKNPAIVGYIGTYEEYLPQQLLRINPTNRLIYAVTKSLGEDIRRNKEFNTEMIDGVQITQAFISGKRGPIHLGLKKVLENIHNNRRCLVISSYPLDYHLQSFKSFVPVFTVLNSYTGELVEGRKLSEKVFKNKSIPFNVYTHALLGDSKSFKGSVSRTEKKKLIQLANSEIWNLRSTEHIRRSLQTNGFKIPFDLNRWSSI